MKNIVIPDKYKSIVDKITVTANEYNFDVYIVGGFVRDIILNRQSKDLDIMVCLKNNDNDENKRFAGINFSKILSKKYNLSSPVIFERFGTAKLIVDNEEVEFVMPRKECYNLNSRNPDTQVTSLQQDALRRDFTINALFLKLNDNTILDFTSNGLSDIEKKIIRVADAQNSKIIFEQDPLRILRAIKQHLQLGFTIEQDTYNSMKLSSKRINIVSYERIRDEINKILVENEPSKAFLMMDDVGLLEEILPEISNLKNIKQPGRYHIDDVFIHSLKVLDRTKNDVVIRMSALLHDTGKRVTFKNENNKISFHNHDVESSKIAEIVLKRFKYSKDFTQKVSSIIRNHMYPKSYSSVWSDTDIRRFVKRCGKEVDLIIELSKADFGRYSNVKNIEELLSRVKDLESKKMLYTKHNLIPGREIMKIFNKPQGKWIQDIKDKIEAMQIENPSISKEDIIKNIKAKCL
ncbi:MAG: CCA tRNA nucleotidyltransferase [Endomicrobium sp.]|jgi:tRNA nucleotidyltransferase/poly(A) polymerase|uniref:CCA tRNA nucleotidyltransferase n=1 Tax=Candidatus Endomicrobiellum cubanum TaxID=3242325 RepID=UPI00282D7D94|nr:CCA tRNA nucleotidyltransferase [Endomicrobium sp.]